jgi:ATP phosphoribosyltransferase regulatory subunit
VAREAKLSEGDAAALLALPSLYGPFPATLERARTLCRNQTMSTALDELAQVYAAVEAVGDAQRLRLDFSLLGATDYYNGILFRGYLEGLPRPVLLGGRYDGILRKLGKAGGGVGFAIQLSELSRLPVSRRETDVDLLLRYGPETDPALVMKAVAEAAAKGLRVRALSENEDGSALRAGQVCRLNEKGEVEPC